MHTEGKQKRSRSWIGRTIFGLAILLAVVLLSDWLHVQFVLKPQIEGQLVERAEAAAQSASLDRGSHAAFFSDTQLVDECFECLPSVGTSPFRTVYTLIMDGVDATYYRVFERCPTTGGTSCPTSVGRYALARADQLTVRNLLVESGKSSRGRCETENFGLASIMHCRSDFVFDGFSGRIEIEGRLLSISSLVLGLFPTWQSSSVIFSTYTGLCASYGMTAPVMIQGEECTAL